MSNDRSARSADAPGSSTDPHLNQQPDVAAFLLMSLCCALRTWLRTADVEQPEFLFSVAVYVGEHDLNAHFSI